MAESVRGARLRRRRARRRRMIAAGVGVVVAGTGTAMALAATTGGSPGQRYATVGRASVTQVVESSGTITSSEKATPSFPVSGTVRSVEVSVGASVAKGQVLARLDATALQDAVDSAESTLANARQKLEADKDGQTSSSAASAANSSSNATTLSTNTASFTALVTTTAPPPSGGSGSQTTLLQQIRAAQQAVVAAQKALDAGQSDLDAAQHTVDSDVTRNLQLRDAQKTACATGTDPSSGPDSDACTSARADYENFADTLAADGKTLAGKVTAQDGNLKTLDRAVATLDTLLGRLSSTSTGSTGSTGTTGTTTPPTKRTTKPTTKPTTKQPTTNQPTTKQPTTPSTGSSTTPSTQTASASQLAADQAAIDAATAQVREAKQSLQAATLRSPIAGKVAAVGLTAGQGSSGGTVTITGTGVPKVSTSVPLAQVKLVKVGQPVSVAADGVSSTLSGRVTSIGSLSSTSGSLTTFPVTVQLAADTPKLFDGAGADVRITTGTARNVVAVPNSAIHTGPRGVRTVTAIEDGKVTTVLVTLGVAGPSLTEVRSGLHAGARVVLADYSTSVPASTNSNTGANRLARLLGGGGNFQGFPGGR